MLELADNVDHGVFVQLFSFSDVPFSFFPKQVIHSHWCEKRNPSWRLLFLFISEYSEPAVMTINSTGGFLWQMIQYMEKMAWNVNFWVTFFFNLFKKFWFGQKANLFRCAFYIIKNARFLSTFYICVSNMWPVKWGGHFELGEYLLLE